ncbi:MAG: hypothetical protein K8R21_03740 [Leptospira sp.]|nr:hypothetical protein [Leptospira sp.]
MEETLHELLNVTLGLRAELSDRAKLSRARIQETINKILLEGQNNNSPEAIEFRKMADAIFQFLDKIKI